MADMEEVRRWVEATLERHPWLRKPKHILVIDDVIVYRSGRGRVLRFSGLQPSWRPDTVVVSWPLRRSDTLVHEIIHTYGLGEDAAWAIAPRLTELRRRLPPLVKARVKYSVCRGGPQCPYRELHEVLGEKLIHLVRVD